MTWTRSTSRLETARDVLGDGPWSRAQLMGIGWTARQISRDLAAGRLAVLRRGVYQPCGSSPDWTDPRTYAVFARPCGDETVSYESAAQVHGLWLPAPVDRRVHLDPEGRPLPSNAVVRRHRARLPAEDVMVVRGVRVTTCARTAVDLALGRDLPQSLVVLDSALRMLALGAGARTAAGRSLLATARGPRRVAAALAQLEAAAERARGRTGWTSLGEALRHVDARSESPYESWSRGVLIEAGLVPEEVGFEARGASGRVYFADLAWPSVRVLIEVDGLAKYGTDTRAVRDRLAAERHRQADLEDAGWVVVRWTAGEPAPRIVARVRRALAAAAAA